MKTIDIVVMYTPETGRHSFMIQHYKGFPERLRGNYHAVSEIHSNTVYARFAYDDSAEQLPEFVERDLANLCYRNPKVESIIINCVGDIQALDGTAKTLDLRL